MLVVWDIHINSKWQKNIINNLDSFLQKFPEEKNIVFVGDYVYHFSYDRNALFDLFSLFVKYFKKWKNIYVLAGNHDWISESFVYQEAKTSFDILNENSNNKIHFITKPFWENIEWEDVFFLPYNHNLVNCSEKFSSPQNDIESLINQLVDSEKSNEQFSAWVNKILYDNIKNLTKKAFVIHHYYFSNISFPGQKAKFNFNNVSISEKFLDMYDDVYFMSGHLHQWFVYKNYFCTWSVRSSSFLEQNQVKYLYQMNLAEQEIFAYWLNINPFVALYESQNSIDKEFFQKQLDNIQLDNQKNFDWWSYTISFEDDILEMLYKNINLVLYSDKVDYDTIYDIIDKDLLHNLKDIKIRKKSKAMDDILDMASSTQKNLEESFSNWKDILVEFLKNKYNDDYEKYHNKLKQLKIL